MESFIITITIKLVFVVQLASSFTPLPSFSSFNSQNAIERKIMSTSFNPALPFMLIGSDSDINCFYRSQKSHHILKYATNVDTILPDSLPSYQNEEEKHETKSNKTSQKSKQTRNIQKKKNDNRIKSRSKTPKKLSKQEELWNTRYQELVEFYTANGHSNVPYNHPNRKLSRWVTNQRQNKKLKKRCMTKQRIEALEKVQFTFSTRCTWEDRFEELKAFSLLYGHCDVPSSTNVDLSRFVKSQRRQYKLYLDEKEIGKGDNVSDGDSIGSNTSTSCSMTEEKIVALISIGFDFKNDKMNRGRRSDDSAWQAKYNQLKQYHQSQNHSCLVVPSKDTNLRRWVDTQRTAYRLLNRGEKSSLTQQRIDLLNEINFVWDPVDARFNERIKELKDFQRTNGHCMVSHTTNPTLHTWIKRQRNQYQKYKLGQKSSLTTERIELLEHTGLQLEVEDFDYNGQQQKQKTPWNKKFHQLQKYATENGHCMVPQKHPHLGKFVKAQRSSYRLMKMGKKSSMTLERIKKLNSIGFVWNVSNRRDARKEVAVSRALERIRARQVHPVNTSSSSNSEVELLEYYERISLWGQQIKYNS